MKKLCVLLAVSFVSVASAQDYSGFSTDVFTISAKGEVVKKKGLSGNFDSDKKENYTYKVKLDDREHKDKLSIEKNDGKISRLTFRSDWQQRDEKEKKVDWNDSSKTFALDADGKIISHTDCADRDGYLLLGKQTKCVTINKLVCDYLAEESSQVLQKKLSECSDLLDGLEEHKNTLLELTKTAYSEDSKAISKINGRFSKESSAYDVDVKQLYSMNSLLNSTNTALELCKKYGAQTVSVETPVSAEIQKKPWYKRMWGKTKKVLPFVKSE